MSPRSLTASPITWALLGELERCVEQADLDASVHVLLLAGAGRGFCGGYDAGTLGFDSCLPPPRSMILFSTRKSPDMACLQGIWMLGE
jgi:enoyl-CoA hydratase/carnithine racemase